MTSRGRKALSVTCGDSSPKGRAKASYIGIRNGAYLYRYAPFTVLRLPLNARAARKSDGRKTVSVPAPPLPPCGRGGRAQRGRRGQITATSNRKMLAPSQADDVPRAQGSQSPVGDSSPKGRAKASYIGTRNGAYLYRYAPFTVLRLPSMRVPPESRMVVKRFPSRHSPCLPCGRGGRAQRGRRGQITATSNRKMLAPSQADDVPRAQGPLSVTCGDSSPKGRAKASYIGIKEMERICIDTLHSLFYGYPSMRVPPESRMVVKRFPSRHPLPLPVGEVAERSEDGEGK